MSKDLRPGLRAFLLADGTLSSAVGSARIYPVKLPQGITAASLVYNLISEVGDVHNAGPNGLCEARIQIDAYATTADAAMSLAIKAKDRLFGYSGDMGTGGDLVQVRGVFLGGAARTDFDEVSNLHRVGRDFLILFWDR